MTYHRFLCCCPLLVSQVIECDISLAQEFAIYLYKFFAGNNLKEVTEKVIICEQKIAVKHFPWKGMWSQVHFLKVKSACMQ